MPDAVPPFDALWWTPRIHLALFVHRVDGLQPGLYALVRTEAAIGELRDAFKQDFAWVRPPACRTTCRSSCLTTPTAGPSRVGRAGHCRRRLLQPQHDRGVRRGAGRRRAGRLPPAVLGSRRGRQGACSRPKPQASPGPALGVISTTDSTRRSASPGMRSRACITSPSAARSMIPVSPRTPGYPWDTR